MVMAQVTLMSYVEGLSNNSPELPGPAEQDSILTQRGTRDWPGNASRPDHPVEAGRPTIAIAEAYSNFHSFLSDKFEINAHAHDA